MANVMTQRQAEIIENITDQMVGELAEMYDNVPDSISDAAKIDGKFEIKWNFKKFPQGFKIVTDEGTFTVAVNITLDAE